MYFWILRRWMKYIFPKGYIAVDGTSLTVGEVSGTHPPCCCLWVPSFVSCCQLLQGTQVYWVSNLALLSFATYIVL